MRGEFCVSHYKSGRVRGPACPARPLYIVGWAGRNISHTDCFQSTHINAHLKGGGAAERIDFSVYKGILVYRLTVSGKLRRMFFHLKRKHLFAIIERHIVVVCVKSLGVNLFQLSVAANHGTLPLYIVNRNTTTLLAPIGMNFWITI